MNFAKGMNVVVFDARLKSGGPGGVECQPPRAWQQVLHLRNMPVSAIVDAVRRKASSLGGPRAQADLLALLCHGAPGMLELGTDNVTLATVDLFAALRGLFRRVEIYACEPAAEDALNAEESTGSGTWTLHNYRWELFRRMAEQMDAPVRVARDRQFFKRNPLTAEIEFQPWNGVFLDIYPGGVVNETGNNR